YAWQLQFGRRFADDDALLRVDFLAERVQQRRLSARDASGDDDVLAGPNAGGQELAGLRAEEAELLQLGERAGAQTEAADRADRVPVRGDRRDRGGDPGAIW